MSVSKASVIVLFICVAVTVDYVRSQTTGPPGGAGTTAMMTTVGGEVEFEMEEMLTTTTAKPKPKPKARKRPKGRRRKPKNLKPKPKTAAARRTTAAPKPVPTLPPTTPRRIVAATYAPTMAPIVLAPTHAPAAYVRTLAPTYPPHVQPLAHSHHQHPAAYAQPAGRGGVGVGHQMHVVQHVYQQPVPTTTPAPTTKSPNQYLYEPHSCPKMDVATWENEVVIYDNKNCAIIIRMNPRLRRPTVTFQAPYW